MENASDSESDTSLEDIRSVFNLSDPDHVEVEESTEKEDRDVLRQDNEELYQSQRKLYEILTIVMCCLFLFSTSYSKATPKDMQKTMPNVQEKFEMNKQPLIYPMTYTELGANLFAGYCVTRWDSKITLMVFMVLCFSGSLLCSLSIWYHIWWWFPVGRVIFGLGVASLRISVNVVIKESVHPDQLGTYMQFPRTAEKLASMSDGWFCSWAVIESAVEQSPSWMVLPFIVGTGLIAISLPFFTLFCIEPKNKNDILDRAEREKRKQEMLTQQGIEMVVFHRSTCDPDNTMEPVGEGRGSGENTETTGNTEITEMDDGTNIISNTPSLSTAVNSLDIPQVVPQSMMRLMFEKIKSFPRAYWMIIIIFFFNDAATGVYQGVLPQFLNIYDIPKNPDSFWEKPGTVRQIPLYFAIFSPIFGLIVDRSVASIGLVVHHGMNVLMAVGSLNRWPWISSLQPILYPNLLFQGFCNCFLGAVLFPGIAFVTERSALSIAYGCQASLGSAASVLFTNIISQWVFEHDALNKNLVIPDDQPIPVTIYSVYMTLSFFISAIASMLLILAFSIYRHDICPPQGTADASAQTMEILQDMERRGVCVETRIRKASRRVSKRRIKMPRQRQRRRRTSLHYINRFG